MNNGTIQQVYADNPHALVTSHVSLEAESNRDFDLEAMLQFVCNGMAASFDFSAYVLVSDDLSDLSDERQRIADEVEAVNNLSDAVEAFRKAFMEKASESLDRLMALQGSAM